MIAVVHRVPKGESVGLLQVAGSPLVVRQIEWLRAVGFERVVLELGTDPASVAVLRWLEANASGDAEIVHSDLPTGPREAARRAGVLGRAPVLAVPADMLGDGDLRYLYGAANEAGVVALFRPPAGLESVLGGGTMRLVSGPIRASQPPIVGGPGWGVRLASDRDAGVLTDAVNKGILPPQGGPHAWPIVPGTRSRRGMRRASKSL